MNRNELVTALSNMLSSNIATDLVEQFLTLRQDVATHTLGRAAPGKLVETLVQALQFMESGKFDANPDVDAYLRNVEARPSKLPDGLRICGARIARAMYSLRSKRGIAHKGEVDPNYHDLQALLAMAQWIIAELVRITSNLAVDEAGRLLTLVHAPVGGLVEDFGDRRLVQQNLHATEEILVLLHSYYPEPIDIKKLITSLDRQNSKTIRNALRTMWKKKLIQGTSQRGYHLTERGFEAAASLVLQLVSDQQGDV